MLCSILGQRLVLLQQYYVYLQAIDEAKQDARTKALWRAGTSCGYARALTTIEQEFKGLKTFADMIVASPPDGDHKMADRYRAAIEEHHELVRKDIFDAILDTDIYLEDANGAAAPTDGKMSTA